LLLLRSPHRPWTGLEPADDTKKYKNNKTDFKKVTVRSRKAEELREDELRFEKVLFEPRDVTEGQKAARRTKGNDRTCNRVTRCVE
jgi:hypothetical protein